MENKAAHSGFETKKLQNKGISGSEKGLVSAKNILEKPP